MNKKKLKLDIEAKKALIAWGRKFAMNFNQLLMIHLWEHELENLEEKLNSRKDKKGGEE